MSRTVREIADELFGLFDRTNDLRYQANHEEAAHLALAWYARTWHTTKALLLLHDRGFDPEAAPMRRSLIEHALALQWIGHSPDAAYDAYAKTHKYFVVSFAEKPESAGAVLPETHEALLAMELNGGPESYLVGTYQLAKKYGPEGAYTAWFHETGGSHPSWRSSSPYRTGREAQSPLDAVMPVLWLLLASAGFSMLLEGDPWAETLERLDAEMAEHVAAAMSAEAVQQSE